MRRLSATLLAATTAAAALATFALYGPWPVELAAGENALAHTRLVSQAAAQENSQTMPVSTTTTTTQHGGWTVTCTEGGEPSRKVCTARFQVINKQNNQTLLAWVFGRNQKGDLLAEFVTPTDVQVQPGVAVILDEGKPIKADYVECGARGCKARLELPANLVRQMKGGKKARIDVTRIDGQVIQFSMEVAGIDAALGELGV